MASDEDRKRYFFLVIMMLIVVALVIAIFAPNVFAQSPTDNTGGFSYTRLQTSIDQCNAEVGAMHKLVDDTSKNCIVSTERVSRLSDGFKFYVVGALGVSVALNASLVYYLLRKKREAAKPILQGGSQSG